LPIAFVEWFVPVAIAAVTAANLIRART